MDHPRHSARKERASARARSQRNRNLFILFGGALLLAVLFLLFSNRASSQGAVPPRVGSSFGDFTLTTFDGKTVHLADYQGKPVLVNFWATWCPPCRAEMPLLNQYYQDHKQQDFTILAVNAGDSQSAVAAFASQNGITFPLLLDPGMSLIDQIGISSFPTSVLIGRDGKVKTIHVGMFTSEALITEVTPYLSQ